MAESGGVLRRPPVAVQGRQGRGAVGGLPVRHPGDGGGRWHADIDDGALSVAEGDGDAPSITITASDEDWLSIVNGRLNPQMAFMTGKLKVKGDMGLAMRLQSIFF